MDHPADRIEPLGERLARGGSFRVLASDEGEHLELYELAAIPPPAEDGEEASTVRDEVLLSVEQVHAARGSAAIYFALGGAAMALFAGYVLFMLTRRRAVERWAATGQT